MTCAGLTFTLGNGVCPDVTSGASRYFLPNQTVSRVALEDLLRNDRALAIVWVTRVGAGTRRRCR